MLQFVTVHKVVDGKITLWKDYWDMGGLANNAPPTWLEDVRRRRYVVDVRRDRSGLRRQ